MRVSVLTREYPPFVYGGAGVHVDFLVRELRRLVDVDVLCLGEEREGATSYAEKDPRLGDANSTLHLLSADVAMAAGAAGSDVVHSHTWYANMAGHFAKLLYDVPHVVTAHSLEPQRPWKARAGRRHAGAHRDHGVGGQVGSALDPGGDAVATAELLRLPWPQWLQGVRGHDVRHVVQQLGEVAGHVGVPGVECTRSAPATRPPSPGRPTGPWSAGFAPRAAGPLGVRAAPWRRLAHAQHVDVDEPPQLRTRKSTWTPAPP